MPLVNSFLKNNQIKNEKTFELGVAYCPRCNLVQLTKTISPEILFKDYIYFSSVSETLLIHAQETAKKFQKKYKLSSDDLVFEIASNDGYQLQYFKNLGIKVLGIDPAKNIAKVANKKGIKTIPDFFNKKTAIRLRKQGVAPKIIYGQNVLAHVPKIHDFALGVKILLPEQGIASFEFPYGKGLLEGKFDTIYHEHVFYYTLTSVKNVFASVGLCVYDYEITPMQGNSLRIYIKHSQSSHETQRLKKLLEKEKSDGYTKFSTYKRLSKIVAASKKSMINRLDAIKKSGKTIAAYSAPAKGLILLNYFEIGSNYLDFICDKAKEKQDLYAPGIHMKIYPPNEVLSRQPDYLLILCWNIAEEVIDQMKDYKDKGGKFIIPIPHIVIK